MVFLSQKFDRNMIFTDYWKVLVSTLSEMGNTVFSWAKKLTEIWYLLITERSCFNLFGNGKYGLFLSQKVDGNMIFTDYWKILVLNFSLIGNTVLFWVKKLMEKWYLLVTEKFWLMGVLVDGKYGLFSLKKLIERYLRGLFELSMIFQDLGNMVFRAVYQLCMLFLKCVA